MSKNKSLTEKQKKTIAQLYLQAPKKKHDDISDSKWIQQKMKHSKLNSCITEGQIRRQIQELQNKKYGKNAPPSDEARQRVIEEYEKPLPRDFIDMELTRPEYVARMTRYHIQKVKGYISDLYKTKYATLIIDTTSHSKEKMSEINFLEELIRIYYKGTFGSHTAPKPYKVKGKERVLSFLKNSKANYIHISAHGNAHFLNKTIPTEIDTGFGGLEARDIYSEENGIVTRLWPEEGAKPTLIVCTACETGRVDIAEAFWKSGCEYYIAPLRVVPWVNATVFDTLFYFYLIVMGLSPSKSFKAAVAKLPNKEGTWRFYHKGKLKASSDTK